MSETKADDDNDGELQQQHHAPTILLRVRRQRRGAITASSATLRVELDAALAAADDAFNDWDIHSSDDHIKICDDDDVDDDVDDQLRINESTTSERDGSDCNHHQNKNHRHHRISVSSRSRQSVTSISTLATTTTTTSTAIFRRIESSSLTSHDERSNSFHFHRSKRPRILDAVLLADDDFDDDDELDHNGECTENVACRNQNYGSRQLTVNRNQKRRRLTLQILEPHKVAEEQRRRRRSSRLLQYPILSPQQRAIDDSLQQVFAGTVTLPQHCQLMHESVNATTTTADESDVFWPYVWCHVDYGNWLHAAAIWNETNVVREMFHILEERFRQQPIETSTISSKHRKHASLIRDIFQKQNSEGLNPIQVAQLSSNSEVQAVLEHYYDMYDQGDSSTMHGDGDDDMSDDDHQYELYSLVVTNHHPGHQNNMENEQFNGGEQQLSDANENDPLLITHCELHNGCRGYWDERGNLILEAPSGNAALDLDVDPNENRQNGTHPENLDMDDIDSNDEEWDGNDYPDDDGDDDILDSDDDHPSDNEDYDDFRRRHVNLFSHRNVVKCNNIDDYDEEEEEDAHYDPSYGDVYGQSNSLYRS